MPETHLVPADSSLFRFLTWSERSALEDLPPRESYDNGIAAYTIIPISCDLLRAAGISVRGRNASIRTLWLRESLASKWERAKTILMSNSNRLIYVLVLDENN